MSMKLTDKDLRACVAVSELAHAGQEYGGKPFFTAHVWEVVRRCKGLDAKCLAAVHDVMELPDWTALLLMDADVPETVARRATILLQKEGESYHDYITRAMSDPVTVEVKKQDLIVNISAGQLSPDRMHKYAVALARLTEQPR